jgi:hypothetical protein
MVKTMTQEQRQYVEQTFGFAPEDKPVGTSWVESRSQVVLAQEPLPRGTVELETSTIQPPAGVAWA